MIPKLEKSRIGAKNVQGAAEYTVIVQCSSTGQKSAKKIKCP